MKGLVVAAIKVPMEVFVVIMVGILVVAAVLWSIIGIQHLNNRWQIRKRIKSSLARTGESFKEDLPWEIGDKAAMIDAVADGLVLTFVFKINGPVEAMTPRILPEIIKKEVSLRMLKREVVLANMKDGAIYQFQFVDQDAKVIKLLTLAHSDFK
jgi:hypothetical protein